MIRHIYNLTPDSINQAYRRFADLRLWEGPSLDFHSMTISYLRQNQRMPIYQRRTLPHLLQDQYFLILLYGTLATWGINRMGARRRMIRFNAFVGQVSNIADRISDISEITLSNSNLDQIMSRREQILSLFRCLNITTIRFGPSEDQPDNDRIPLLVSNSKLLHHLHPDLIPPIDREYIVRYFYCRNINVRQVSSIGNIAQQADRFWEILIEYKKFYDLHEDIVNGFLSQNITGMETSITKITDNIVVGHTSVMREYANAH